MTAEYETRGKDSMQMEENIYKVHENICVRADLVVVVVGFMTAMQHCLNLASQHGLLSGHRPYLLVQLK